MTIQEGPLVWPYLPMCDLTDPGLGLSPQQQDAAVQIAIEWLWARSARRLGTRSVVFRPQTATPPPMSGPLLGWPGNYGYSGGNYGFGGGYCGTSDTRERQRVIELPPPVVSVENIIISGAALDPELYRLEGRFLVRQDGDPWPQTQNMIAALGNLDTWAVYYTRGFPVTTYGQYATGRLICYFSQRMKEGKPCELPYNTTTVSRGGVTINRDKGKAGQTSPVPEVEQWLALVNPNGLQTEPLIWSPDTARSRWPFSGSYAGQSQPQVPQGQPSAANVLVLAPDQQVPPGTPAGTVILYTDGTAVPAGVAPHLVVPLGAQPPAGAPPGTVILQTEP